MAEGASATEPRSGRKSPRWNTHKMLEAAKAGADQITDYSRYDIALFSEKEKRAHRVAQFPVGLANARALGKRLVEKAKAH